LSYIINHFLCQEDISLFLKFQKKINICLQTKMVKKIFKKNKIIKNKKKYNITLRSAIISLKKIINFTTKIFKN
jgi:hypothetical protein